jgi:hypothetical protein
MQSIGNREVVYRPGETQSLYKREFDREIELDIGTEKSWYTHGGSGGGGDGESR